MATISTAESCTGGRIAANITQHSGASKFFLGGIVAYQNEVKEKMLGVPHEMIEEYGVVSKEVVEAMVKGSCRLFGSEYAIASTGYAEPFEDHDVEIWVGWGCEDDVHSVCLTDNYNRVRNLDLATLKVMKEFVEYLRKREVSRYGFPPEFFNA